jgi:hypothetical protein
MAGLTKAQIVETLKALPRYDVEYQEVGCDCCSPSIEFQVCNYGDYLKWDDLHTLVLIKIKE